MNNSLILRPLHVGDEKTFLEATKEWNESHLKDEFAFLPQYYKDGMDWREFLRILHDESLGINLIDGRVSCSFLGGFVEGKLVGRVSFRHELNDFLFRVGGHIGYGVLPTERKKSFATEMLLQTLTYCRSMNLKKILITCDDDNIGSIKTIEKNGGVLENIYHGPELGGKPKRRYWIKV